MVLGSESDSRERPRRRRRVHRGESQDPQLCLRDYTVDASFDVVSVRALGRRRSCHVPTSSGWFTVCGGNLLNETIRWSRRRPPEKGRKENKERNKLSSTSTKT
jgi:hypothetical protein